MFLSMSDRLNSFIFKIQFSFAGLMWQNNFNSYDSIYLLIVHILILLKSHTDIVKVLY